MIIRKEVSEGGKEVRQEEKEERLTFDWCISKNVEKQGSGIKVNWREKKRSTVHGRQTRDKK